MTHYDLIGPGGPLSVEVVSTKDGYRVGVGNAEFVVRLKRGTDKENPFVVEVSDKPAEVTVIEATATKVELILGGLRLSFERPAPSLGVAKAPPRGPSIQRGTIPAPMPGKVIGVLVKRGERVKSGDPLVILESMKMEIAVRADTDSEVEDILVEEGESVKRGQGLARLG